MGSADIAWSDDHSVTRPGVFVLRQGEDGLRGWNASGSGGGGALTDLASALSRSPAWEGYERVALVVREAPVPSLALVGLFDRRGAARARVLQQNLSRTLNSLRYVDYQRAEADCERLAECLTAQIGRDELARCGFVGLPRGGLIVLGMLSYVLGLKHAQIEARPAAGVPLVVVDDCALTGNRFHRFLASNSHEPLIFAHLYSPPRLRERIVEREPRVAACVAAHDLRDHGGDDVVSLWSERWGGMRYGVGSVEHVAFAWREPDIGAWNEEANQVELGWHVIPPSRCLGTRHARAWSIPIQVQPGSAAAVEVAPSVVYARFDSEVILGDLATEQGYRLEGVTADLWLALAERSTVDEAVAALSARYDVAEDRLRDDVSAFVRDLQAAGIVMREAVRG